MRIEGFLLAGDEQSGSSPGNVFDKKVSVASWSVCVWDELGPRSHQDLGLLS